MEDIAVQVEHVSKHFILPHQKITTIKSAVVQTFQRTRNTKEKQHALEDISFTVKKGEFFGIVGRNGSGKSTMLKILARIYQPTKGTLHTQGKLVPFIELGVGFNPELTGRENVYLNGAMLGFSRAQVDAMYDDVVSFAELERFMDQKLKNYSSGMQVRLAFSIATRAEADILLVDEVLAVGDADFQRKCFEYFRELKKRKKTVIFVSHDMNAVREYCDRAILIDKSRIVAADNAEEIAKEYTKLFSEPTVSEAQGSSKWGAGGVDIEAVETSKKRYTEKDDNIDIRMTIRASQDWPDGLVAGITIKNEIGEALCGTNSKIIRNENIILKKGESCTLAWTVPNIFNEGQLIIEPAVVEAGTMRVCQWWNDAKTFRVLNVQKTPYPVAPRITMKQTT